MTILERLKTMVAVNVTIIFGGLLLPLFGNTTTKGSVSNMRSGD
jgi:hypothetical protein